MIFDGSIAKKSVHEILADAAVPMPLIKNLHEEIKKSP
jgi:hypothetical protein